MMVTVVFFILFLLLPTVGVGAFHLLSWVKGGANLPQSIFYNNQVLHIFPIYFLSNAEFSSSLLQHVKQFSTITKSYIPACSNISKLIINNDQALLLHVQNLQTDLNSKYICVVDEELQLHQYVPMPHPNSIAAVLHMVYLVTKNLPQIKNYFVSNQELQKYEKLSNMENSE